MSEPFEVKFEKVAEALASLGIGSDNLLSVHLERRRITVERARTDDEGRMWAAGDEIATVTTTIGITR